MYTLRLQRRVWRFRYTLFYYANLCKGIYRTLLCVCIDLKHNQELSQIYLPKHVISLYNMSNFFRENRHKGKSVENHIVNFIKRNFTKLLHLQISSYRMITSELTLINLGMSCVPGYYYFLSLSFSLFVHVWWGREEENGACAIKRHCVGAGGDGV